MDLVKKILENILNQLAQPFDAKPFEQEIVEDDEPRFGSKHDPIHTRAYADDRQKAPHNRRKLGMRKRK